MSLGGGRGVGGGRASLVLALGRGAGASGHGRARRRGASGGSLARHFFLEGLCVTVFLVLIESLQGRLMSLKMGLCWKVSSEREESAFAQSCKPGAGKKIGVR